jgi:hypothetical protein
MTQFSKPAWTPPGYATDTPHTMCELIIIINLLYATASSFVIIFRVKKENAEKQYRCRNIKKHASRRKSQNQERVIPCNIIYTQAHRRELNPIFYYHHMKSIYICTQH